MDLEKFEWTTEKLKELIGEVKRNPCVWRKGHPQYMNKFAKANAFVKIAAALGVSPEAAREKTRNLRTQYLQIQRKKLRSGSAAASAPKWELFSHLNFLSGELSQPGEIDFLNSTKEDVTPDVIFTPDYVPEIITPDDMIEPPRSPIYSPELPPQGKKRKRDDITEALTPLFQELQNTRTELDRASSNTPNEEFGEYVAKALDQCSDSIGNRTKARIRIILGEAVTESAKQELQIYLHRTRKCDFNF